MKKVVMCAPFNTRSGYGDHARSIFYSIMDRDDIDISCIDVKWGATPRNHLNPEIPRHKKLLDTFKNPQEINTPVDIYIDIRIPNEYQNPAKFNIGITAGVETDIVSPEFIAGVNMMNLNIVPSRFTAATFAKCTYDQMEDMPDGQKRKIGEVRLEKPMDVIFEGVDTDVYCPKQKHELEKGLYEELDDLIKEDFAYLHVGQWGKGGYGEDRKNIPLMIKNFLKAFTNHPNPPALVLKTNGASFSILDKVEILRRIKRVTDEFAEVDSKPSIYLIHGDFTINEMSTLYNHPKIKAFLTCTHGEGFGRPMLEASCCDLPVIDTLWSGLLDFLNDRDSLFIGGHLKEVPKSAIWKPIVVEPSKWYNVNEADVVRKVRMFHKKHKLITKKAKRLGKKNRREFSLQAMAKVINTMMDNVISQMPSEVGLKLPKLKKVGGKNDSSAPATIKLPKLRKVN